MSEKHWLQRKQEFSPWEKDRLFACRHESYPGLHHAASSHALSQNLFSELLRGAKQHPAPSLIIYQSICLACLPITSNKQRYWSGQSWPGCHIWIEVRGLNWVCSRHGPTHNRSILFLFLSLGHDCDLTDVLPCLSGTNSKAGRFVSPLQQSCPLQWYDMWHVVCMYYMYIYMAKCSIVCVNIKIWNYFPLLQKCKFYWFNLQFSPLSSFTLQFLNYLWDISFQDW